MKIPPDIIDVPNLVLPVVPTSLDVHFPKPPLSSSLFNSDVHSLNENSTLNIFIPNLPSPNIPGDVSLRRSSRHSKLPAYLHDYHA